MSSSRCTMNTQRTVCILGLMFSSVMLYMSYQQGQQREHLCPPAPPMVYECAHKAVHTGTEKDRILTELSGHKIKHDSPRLVKAIAEYMIDLPRPYASKFSMMPYNTPQAKAAMSILNKDNGFFVECGGLDGERSSNTIYMEHKNGWNGLLIEMDPSWYMQLRGKNRKSYSINSCLSPVPYPTIMEFDEHPMGEGKLSINADHTKKTIMKTFCFPLYSIMLALNRTTIDFFSLDVEGYELPILKTIPFDKLDIKVLAVEYIHGKDGGKAYEDFMISQGYRVHSKIQFSKEEIYLGVNDYIFVKNTL